MYTVRKVVIQVANVRYKSIDHITAMESEPALLGVEVNKFQISGKRYFFKFLKKRAVMTCIFSHTHRSLFQLIS